MKSILVTGANGTKRLACQAVSLGIKCLVLLIWLLNRASFMTSQK